MLINNFIYTQVACYVHRLYELYELCKLYKYFYELLKIT